MKPEVQEELVRAARAARANAYAPYSGFRVGAALLGESGHVHRGVNVENAAYPVGMCAERTAIGAAVTAGEKRLIAVAVVTPLPEPLAPCGMCRQALAELGPDLTVIMTGPHEGDPVRVARLSKLLPGSFDAHALERGQAEEPR